MLPKVASEPGPRTPGTRRRASGRWPASGSTDRVLCVGASAQTPHRGAGGRTGSCLDGGPGTFGGRGVTQARAGCSQTGESGRADPGAGVLPPAGAGRRVRAKLRAPRRGAVQGGGGTPWGSGARRRWERVIPPAPPRTGSDSSIEETSPVVPLWAPQAPTRLINTNINFAGCTPPKTRHFFRLNCYCAPGVNKGGVTPKICGCFPLGWCWRERAGRGGREGGRRRAQGGQGEEKTEGCREVVGSRAGGGGR